MRDRDTPLADVKAAYKRSLSPEPTSCDGVTTLEVCTAYLAKVESEGAAATFASRQATLFYFCFGLSMKFIKAKPEPSDYIHKGYGRLAVAELLPIHIDRWLQAHPNWKGGHRTKIQAVKRALNYGVESGLIIANPIRGYKTPKQNGRATYLTPEQETALIGAANPSLATAIKVCIRTGARPGCEFAKLTAKHVRDHGKRMEWVFKPEESKTKALRTIRITDPEIIAIVRQQIELHPIGPIFRALNGGRWTRPNLTEKFR